MSNDMKRRGLMGQLQRLIKDIERSDAGGRDLDVRVARFLFGDRVTGLRIRSPNRKYTSGIPQYTLTAVSKKRACAKLRALLKAA